MIFITGEYIVTTMSTALQFHFTISREEIFNTDTIFKHITLGFYAAAKILTPILICSVVAIILSSIMMSGWNYSSENLGFKFERLNPLSGLKRMFSKRSLIELVKSCMKFIVVCVVAVLYLKSTLPSILTIGNHVPEIALKEALENVMWGFLYITASMSLLLFIDVPYQWWEHIQQLRMSKQELKDEFRESEGNPEIKRRVRQVQHEISNRRMMQQVPLADVVITNPTHYAIALRYMDDRQSAPVVVAKGVDAIAEQIRKIATEHNVILVAAPPLARSIYHTTQLEREIPVGLYVAVAQVLAYVYQLKRYQRGESLDIPMPLENLPIPDDLAY